MKTEKNKKAFTDAETQKYTLPSIRGGIGRGESSFETLKTDRFQKKKSQHLTPSPSPYKGEGSRKAAFTLAETMIVLIVLGVIAAITVPGLVRRQIDSANRTKVKKAMTSYDLALNKMVIENGIRGNNDLTTFAPLNNCTNTSTYFKAVENIDNNICKFKTSDGVWWDISDITHPIIALDRDNLTAANAAYTNNNKAYYLVGRFDDNTGILRVDDLKYETTANNATEKGYLEKLYGFLNKQAQAGGSEQAGGNACAANDIACLVRSSGSNVPDVPRCQNNVRVSCADFWNENSDLAAANIYDADGNYVGHYSYLRNEITGQFYKGHEYINNADGSNTNTYWEVIGTGEHAGEVYKLEETINNADGSRTYNGWAQISGGEHAGEVYKTNESINNADGSGTSTIWGAISTGEHAGEVYKLEEGMWNSDWSESCYTEYDEGGNITYQEGNACN